MFNKGDLVRLREDCSYDLVDPAKQRYLSDKIWEVIVCLQDYTWIRVNPGSSFHVVSTALELVFEL